ncbi:rhodanese-like domain-containing protein [Oharaeibacter diazotrophicus]|uniref:Rhodanese-related sulfurtransferase n=1 Tax=Oharaeibacter diazotrophicus TaxID=1920512 RepID=A0A4R6RBD8_9HYPH|nr:rhodanese-like domain-containing protein [Oharaeibacter diazotrophicus]TDP83344.1 rhodanese-related sulfurtransferase [Oharaeibacter diazotrophicus]BBE72177.1 molybdopterin biosynthesis protein MoeB [Pleomorphomonas sp. SM30]GLS78943.1 rhodanese [Oharaeibacter diazotrophicus]
MRKGYKDLLREAEAEITAVPVDEAIALAAAGEVLFVDLRDPREREREGSIPGAFSCPRGMLEFWIDPDSPYFKPVFGEGRRTVFFCASAWRSALATRTAQDMGLPAVSHLTGGFTAWKAAGGAVEEIGRKPPASTG